jgi:hypothetical protein
MWRLVLGDTPTAAVLDGANLSVVGFPAAGIAGKLCNPESADGSVSSVFPSIRRRIGPCSRSPWLATSPGTFP